MTTVFQPNVFQFSVFQIDAQGTILTGHRAPGGGLSRKKFEEIRAAQRAQEALERQAEELKQSKKKAALENAAKAAQAAIDAAKADEDALELLDIHRMTAAMEAAAGATRVAEVVKQAKIVQAIAASITEEIDDEEEVVMLLLQ